MINYSLRFGFYDLGKTMNRGISFYADAGFNSSVLWDILNCIDVEKYTWYFIDSQSEVWANAGGDDLFMSDCYSGENFSQLIKQKYYIIFLKLQAYSDTYKFLDIHTYEDFVKSNCKILILVNDSNYFDVYLKDKVMIDVFYNHLKSHGFKNLDFITDKNDYRRKMDVL